MDGKTTLEITTKADSMLAEKMHRRRFLRFSGVAASTAIVLVTACNKDDGPNNNEDGIDLGSGDTGILNYAYALEQLEAAFYTQVIATPFSGMTALETSFLTDIRDHEIAHREFFKKALSNDAISALTPNFGAVNFSDRTSVLNTAKAFEDLGVSAYNGAGKLITNPAYLVLAGKIVSVEARHAAWIRDLIAPGSFADNTVIDADGLDLSKDPTDVLAIANTFLTTKVSGKNLPTS
jgi:hypothetical protein